MFTSKTPLTIDQIAKYAPSALAVEPHASRSARYEFIPTVEVIRGLEREGFLPFAINQSLSRIEDREKFTKHMIRFRHQSMTEVAVGGTLPEVVLVNSHDGSSAYQLLGGLFRLVCGNGLIVSDALIASVKVRHTGDIVRDVIDASFRVAEQSRHAMNVIGAWRALELSSGEQTALAVAAHHVRFADPEGRINTPITPDQLLHIRRSEDAGNDLWKVTNRIQENVLRGGLVGRANNPDGSRGRRVSTRQINGIDQDVKLNRALWKLSEEMAKLKGDQSQKAFAAAAGK